MFVESRFRRNIGHLRKMVCAHSFVGNYTIWKLSVRFATCTAFHYSQVVNDCFIAGNLQLTPTAPVYLQFSPTNGAWHSFFSSKLKYIFTIAPDEVVCYNNHDFSYKSKAVADLWGAPTPLWYLKATAFCFLSFILAAIHAVNLLGLL